MESERSARRRRLADRVATAGVAAGGLAVIASILGILVFLVVEVWPLLRPARVEPLAPIPAAGPAALALTMDEHRTHVAALGADGVVRVFARSGEVALERPLVGPPHAAIGGAPSPLAAGEAATGEPAPRTARTPPISAASAPPGDSVLAATTADGKVHVVAVAWRAAFRDGAREVTPELGETASLALDPDGRAVGAFAARRDPETGHLLAAAQLADGSIAVAHRERETNFLTGEASETTTRTLLAPAPELTMLVADRAGRMLYGATRDGRLLSWDLRSSDAPAPAVADSGAPITALALLLGERSLLVGQEDGRTSVWFMVDGVLTRVREIVQLPSAVREIAASPRSRVFLAQDASGSLGLYAATSGRTLWAGASPAPGALAAAFAPRGDGAALAGAGEIALLGIDAPHPEASLASLLLPVWYEGHPEPDLVWQSSSGTDDFEPKLSLTPLLAGTLKGTFYSLALAVPLAVLGAMYTSQFMHPRLQRFVKPSVELMASLPSVVLGFLAGLWLAPRVETAFTGIVLCLLVVPLCAIAGGLSWSVLPARWRAKAPAGVEVFWYAVVVAAGLWLSVAASPAIERALFGGSFPQWLLESAGLRYDQRNALVVGIAMGFAVIPIIFAISEDALSNVPGHLSAGSLALGASRWQTVVRVVLPTASPGIFSAVMVGFGRAVGETMIVLMATGNTPIIDWSPFNGFRTLSANVAVEIPEAPVGSTLYRTLFLAALLLFALTFAVNTLAELVRQRLRRRFARL